ncbi:MAG: TonB-dependent receptor, partial [Deltaproteobacteria bacterium]|nr:TonB-dependent receptor [Deltaproteobacteria bacterium]
MSRLSKTFLQLLIGFVISVGGAGFAHAAGFAIIEHSATGMGNAFAGGAAIAEDASTVYFNPAGLMRLEGTQIVNAIHVIVPSADFDNEGSTLNPLVGGAAISGPGDETDEIGLVPNLYIAHRVSDSFAMGLGINAPFGLTTDYDEDWVGRYTAVKSGLLTLNINPALAFRVNDQFSWGVGMNIQYVDVELTNMLDSSTICLSSAAAAACGGLGLGAPGNAAVDSKQKLTGDDWSLGWNLGALYEPTEDLRFGVAYRTKISHEAEGKVNFANSPEFQAFVSTFAPAGVFTNQGASARLTLPETISGSVAADVSDELTLMADITWTHWSRFEELVVNFDWNQPQSTIPEDWEDSWRYSVGARYQRDKLTLRTGVAYDESPIKGKTERTPRIPGNDRTWLSFGIGYQILDNTKLDFGYSHLFVDDTK